MNKAYRQVYKDGIGWVAIAENASCVSSSKGSGTVSSKTKVEVLKNFFDLRNSVVLNNGFLLKGLFAATLFCGVFVGDLRAETSQNIQDKAVSTGGTAVYVDDGGKRFIQNKQGGYIDTEGKGLIKIRDQWYRVDNYDEKGVITLSDGKKYVIPTGTLNAILYDKNYDPYMVAGSGTIREKTPVFFDIEMTLSTKNSNKIVKYDENDKKWYVYNNDGEKLYLARKKEGGQYYGLHKYSELKKNSDGMPIQDKDGYYVLSSSASVSADEVRKGNTFEDLQGNFEKLNGTPDFNKNKPTRLGLVGLDGINTMPEIYSTADKTNGKIPVGREVGDNKNGKIRLGNVAKAELDDEAVNLGQLNEKLEKIPYASINSSEKGPGSNYNSDGATGKDAIAIGVNAKASTESTIAIGRNAGQSEYIGNSIFIGDGSGQNSKKYDKSTNAWGSVVIGQQSGINSTGDANLYIGSTTGASHTGSQNIFLGDTAKVAKYNNKDKGEPERLLNKPTSGNRNIYIGNQYVHSAVPKGEINDSIAIGTLSNASNSKSIAIGSSSSNKKYGALSIGKTSIAIGSSTTDDNNGSTARGDNSISFGSDTLAIENDSVALGAFSVADRKALSDAEKQKVYLAKNTDVANTVKNTKGAISVGKSGENGFTRQITNLAAGAADTDAVNVAQLKAGLSGKADLNAENLSGKTGNPNNANETYTDVWKEKLGINDKADKTEVKNLAKGSVEVEAAKNQDIVEVGKTTANDKDTYTVSVNADKLAKNNTFITSLGDNFAKKDASNIADNKANWETALGLSDYVKSVASTDNFIKVDATEKQNPKLSLDTEKLAGDKTFVTNIAGNNDFTTKLGNTFVTKTNLAGDLAGYTKLDGSNLATIAKNTWRTALGVSDGDIKKVAQESVNVKAETGSKITVADKGIVDGKQTFEVGVDLTGLNGTAYTFAAGENLTVEDKSGKVKYSLNKDLKNITSIENGGKTYTFGDTNLVDTSVITNKDLTTELKNYVTTGNDKTAKVAVSGKGLKVTDDSAANPNQPTYTLSLVEKDIKDIAGTTNLTADLAGKADRNAGNLETADVTSWQTKLGIDKKADKTEVKNLAKGSVEVEAAKNQDIVEVGKTTANDKDTYTVSVNADKLAKNNTFITSLGDNFAKKDASNIDADNANAWKDKLGIKNLNASKLFTAKADGASEGATVKAGEELLFKAGDNIAVSSDASGIKYGLSKTLTGITSITGDTNKPLTIIAGNNKTYTFGDKTLGDTSVITNSDIANIFKGEKGISIDKKANQYIISYKGTGSGTGTGGMTEKEVRTIIKKYIGGDNIDSSTGSTDNIVTHNVSKQETTNNKNIIAAINKINQEGIGFVHVNGGELTIKNGISENDSQANGDNSIAIGPKSQANGGNSIAIGPKSQANGENSIAIGVRNVVTGKNSGAFGDPTHIDKDNSYSVGNNNEINSNDTFVLGNKVRVGAGMEGAVVLGSNSKADKATRVSSAEVKGITYGGFTGQAKGDGMILSVGANGAERQIKNVAAGEISENSTDAVNGSQLYATNNIIGNVANSVKNVIGGNVKVNNNGEISASNIGRTGQPTINDAIASINNKINSGTPYIAIDVPTNGGEVPSVINGSNSIAIGAGSSDDKRKNVVSVGNAKTGLNRTITNVAPGKYGTDAVNMNQLYGVAGGLSKQINDVKKKSSAGIAGAVALGMLPQSNIPGDALVSIGTGYHDSESAVALGISKTSDNARWIFKGGVSYDSQDEVTAGASVGFHF